MAVSNPCSKTEREIKILIVEDNVAFRHSFKDFLQLLRPDIHIQEAVEAAEALEKVDIFCPELIFMDIHLPGENGLSLTKKIKAKHPDIQVIVLTSYDNPEYQEAAIQCGASRFFSKDALNLEEIKALIRSIPS